MDNTLKQIKKINGNTDGDQLTASAFCKEVQIEAEARLGIIENISDLRVILDTKSLAEAKDALLGLRHLAKATSDVATFNSNGRLGDLFGNLTGKVHKILEAAEEKYKDLFSLTQNI